MTSATGQVGSGQEGRPQIGGIHWEGWMQPFNPSTSWSLTAWRVETCFVFPGREGVEDRSEARVDRHFEDKDRWLKNMCGKVRLFWNAISFKTSTHICHISQNLKHFLAGFTYTALKDHDVTEHKRTNGMISDCFCMPRMCVWQQTSRELRWRTLWLRSRFSHFDLSFGEQNLEQFNNKLNWWPPRPHESVVVGAKLMSPWCPEIGIRAVHGPYFETWLLEITFKVGCF